MARASIRTRLPLDTWARIVGINPLHFNGIEIDNWSGGCRTPWMQYSWQAADAVSREEVAEAIQQAEEDMERYLGFHLLPDWDVDERTETARSPRPELLRTSLQDIRGFGQGVQLGQGHFISGGIRSKSLVTAGATIVYTDPDGDNWDELATVTVTTSLPACDIRAYLPGHSGDDDYEIRPVKATADSGAVVLTFSKALCVKPTEYEDILPASGDSQHRAVDGTAADNFETTVDVYRVYNDPQLQVQMMWAPFAAGCPNCSTGGCGTCSYQMQTGCLTTHVGPRQGVVGYHPATWNSATLEFDSAASVVSRQPDLVRLWYYSGVQNRSLDCPKVEMDRAYARAVSLYALSLLDREVCACGVIKGLKDRWQYDYAVQGPMNQVRAPADIDNPFGSTRGALHAWRLVKRNFIGGVVVA